MLSHRPFYNRTIRQLVVGFGNVFNDIHIERKNLLTNNVEQTIKVPLSYASKEFWYNTLKQIPNAGSETQDKKVSVVLPRLGYELKSYSYDSTRATSPQNKNYSLRVDDNTILNCTFSPVPWNFEFQIMAMTRNMDDMLNITEQILPFFRPELTIRINDLNDFPLIREVPIVLNSVQPDEVFNDYGELKSRRFVTNFNFTLKGYLYSPVSNVKIVRRTEINFDQLYQVAINPIPEAAFPNDAIEFEYENTIINSNELVD